TGDSRPYLRSGTGAAPAGATPAFRQFLAQNLSVVPGGRQAGDVVHSSVGSVRAHLGTGEECPVFVFRRRSPDRHDGLGERQVGAQLRRQCTAMGHRHLAMVAVEGPEMALFAVLDESGRVEQTAHVVGWREWLHYIVEGDI